MIVTDYNLPNTVGIHEFTLIQQKGGKGEEERGEKRKLFLKVESQLINVERIMKSLFGN